MKSMYVFALGECSKYHRRMTTTMDSNRRYFIRTQLTTVEITQCSQLFE